MIYRTKTKKLTEEESKEIKKLYDSGMKICDIARKMNRLPAQVKYHTYSEEERKDFLKNKNRSRKPWSERIDQQIEYLNTEAGYMISKYNSIRYSCKGKQNREINSAKKIDLMSQEEFLELWTQHKSKQGITCGYTGEPLVMQRKKPPKVGRNKIPKNQLSVDCLDPEIGYTKQNIVFCSWGFNDRKNAVKIKDCYLIIKKHEERNKND